MDKIGTITVEATNGGKLKVATSHGSTTLRLSLDCLDPAISSLTDAGDFDTRYQKDLDARKNSDRFENWCKQKYGVRPTPAACSWTDTTIYDISGIVGVECVAMFRKWPHAWVFCQNKTIVELCRSDKELRNTVKRYRKSVIGKVRDGKAVQSESKIAQSTPKVVQSAPALIETTPATTRALPAAMARSCPSPADDVLICEGVMPLNASPDVSVVGRTSTVRVELYDGTRLVSAEIFNRMGVPRTIPDFSCAAFDALHDYYHPGHDAGKELAALIIKYDVPIPSDRALTFRTDDEVQLGKSALEYERSTTGKYVVCAVSGYVVQVKNA